MTETATLTLSAFLLARADDIEGLAKAAMAFNREGSWWVDGPARKSGNHWVYATGEQFASRAVAEHIAYHDPGAALADAAAIRRIVEIHPVYSDGDQHDCPGGWRGYMDAPDNPCPTLRILAARWADHDDYRAEWKP